MDFREYLEAEIKDWEQSPSSMGGIVASVLSRALGRYNRAHPIPNPNPADHAFSIEQEQDILNMEVAGKD